MGDYDGLIAGSAQVASTALNNMAAADLNRRGERYNWEMWNVQRQAQIQDWWRTAAYNSPENQRKLLIAGGMNPALMYKGNMFEAMTNGSPPTGQALNLRSPDYSGLGKGMEAYYNIKVQQQQLDNMAAQNHLLDEQANLANKQAGAISSNVRKTNIEADILDNQFEVAQAITAARVAAENMKPDQIQAEIDKINAATGLDLAQADLAGQSVKESASRILKNFQEISNLVSEKVKIGKMIQLLDRDIKLKDWDIKLIEDSDNMSRPHDSMIMRGTAKLLSFLLSIDDSNIKEPGPTKVFDINEHKGDIRFRDYPGYKKK